MSDIELTFCVVNTSQRELLLRERSPRIAGRRQRSQPALEHPGIAFVGVVKAPCQAGEVTQQLIRRTIAIA